MARFDGWPCDASQVEWSRVMRRIVTGVSPPSVRRGGIHEIAQLCKVAAACDDLFWSRFALPGCSNLGSREQPRTRSAPQGDPSALALHVEPPARRTKTNVMGRQAPPTQQVFSRQKQPPCALVELSQVPLVARGPYGLCFNRGRRGDSPSRATGTWCQTSASCLLG